MTVVKLILARETNMKEILISTKQSMCKSCSVVSDSLQPHGLQPARFLCPWNSPGKSTGVGSHSFLQGIFLTQGSNLGLPHCRQILFHLSHQGSPMLHTKQSKQSKTISTLKVEFKGWEGLIKKRWEMLDNKYDLLLDQSVQASQLQAMKFSSKQLLGASGCCQSEAYFCPSIEIASRSLGAVCREDASNLHFGLNVTLKTYIHHNGQNQSHGKSNCKRGWEM